MLRCSRPSFSALTLLAVLGSAHAAELGQARVSSHIGQALVADIELVMIDDPAQAVAVRVARPEVYAGAGIAVPPVLASLNLSVMRRDGRQFLHVTSLRPVDSEHLHLYLELTDKGQRAVRLATLWLTPDPNPAPPPAPAPAPAPAPLAAPELPAPPGAAGAVRKSRPAAAHAALAAQEEGAGRRAPARPHPRARPAIERARAAPASAAPLPIHSAPAAAPAACARQAEQASVCAALDGKNAELNAKLGTLEGKVKALQATLGVVPATATPAAPVPAAGAPAPVAAPEAAPVPAPAPAAAPVAAPEPPGPKPIGAIKPLVPRKHKTPPPEPESGPPWGWMGGAAALLLALGGGSWMQLRRRARTVRNVDIPAGPTLLERLRQRFARPSKAAPAPAAEAVEPSLE